MRRTAHGRAWCFERALPFRMGWRRRPAGLQCPRGLEPPMPDQPTLFERIANLNVWRRGDERAPHKPLLLLYALARVQRGEPRLIPFIDIERDLGRLLERFGPPRHTRPAIFSCVTGAVGALQ